MKVYVVQEKIPYAYAKSRNNKEGTKERNE